MIAEDMSDVAVLYKILVKIIDDNSFSIKRFVGKGCGKLRKKCHVWSAMLNDSGCDHLFVLHDLDENNEKQLRQQLENSVRDSGFTNPLIIIPVKEMEAWLLADERALQNTFNLQKCPKTIHNTEAINNPKEHIRDLIWALGRKRYLNTVHNVRIAEVMTIASLRKCRSFLPLEKYITTYL